MEEKVLPPTKDEIIVRQSQMQRAIEMYDLLGVRPSIREVCRLSKLLTEFIFTWDLNNEKLKKFDEHITKTMLEQIKSSHNGN